MAKVATSKQTGQGGTSFEDKVGAYFMACLLTEYAPLGASLGSVQRIAFQTRREGWLLDDLLLSFQPSTSVAISVKSNRQINSNGFPTELNELLWKQFLHHDSPVFNQDVDFLCLVEEPILPATRTALSNLLKEARVTDPLTLDQRVHSPGYPKTEQKIYKSLAFLPATHGSERKEQQYAGNLLKRILHLEMDFTLDISKDEAFAIELCKNSLKNKNTDLAINLYHELCRLPRDLSPASAIIDRADLLKLLPQFEFEYAPSLREDWETIFRQTKDKLSIIPHTLGDNLVLKRADVVTQIAENLAAEKILVVQGASGAGKTNLVKTFVEKGLEKNNVIWLDSSDFESSSLETQWQLKHSLQDIIAKTVALNSLLVIDGIERIYQEHSPQKIALILKTALEPSSSWKVIFTCPSDQIERVHVLWKNFNLPAINVSSIELPPLEFEQLRIIAERYPELSEILFSKAMENVRSNLKLLDKLIQNANNLSQLSSTKNLGETHLIDFIWSEEIERQANGLQITSFLQQFSEKQADELSTGIFIRQFPSVELGTADTLRAKGFLRTQHQRLYFTHDLYGDWARYKLLASQEKNLASFLKQKHLTSPLWTRAVRLVGMSLLEQELDGQSWHNTFLSFSDGSPESIVAQDLLLEAFFFSPNAYALLDLHKALLFNNEGVLFKRLVKLFLIRATQSDPGMLDLGKKIGLTEKEASAFRRFPIFLYWPGVLKFLHDESQQVLNYSLTDVVTIGSMWLENTPTVFPFRNEASDICLRAAEKIFTLSSKGRYIEDNIEEAVYKGLLLGYPENPEAVKQLSLKICQRVKVEGTESNQNNQNKRGIGGRDFHFGRKEPWPIGPLSRVDSSFRKVCLQGQTMNRLFSLNPQLASEILLAVLIKAPREDAVYGDQTDRHYSLAEDYSWYPPFYLRGPFLNFIRLAPYEGLKFICQLTDFATDRWRDQKDDGASITVVIDKNQKEYYGDGALFSWSKGAGSVPHVLASALMAVEQFFYEQIEQGKDINVYCQFLINNTHSFAVIGVLFSVGKLYRYWLSNHLLPFLYHYELFEWDLFSGAYLRIRENDHIAWQEEIKIWNGRRNRDQTLRNVVVAMLLYDEGFRTEIEKIRTGWEQLIAQTEAHEGRDILLYQLVHQLNFSNYVLKENEGRKYYEYQEPEEVNETLGEIRQSNLHNLLESQIADKMQMMIDDKLPFDLAGAEYLWKRIHEQYNAFDSSIEKFHSGEWAFAAPYKNILAQIKLLLHHKGIWALQHPEYMLWIQEFLEEIIERQFGYPKQFEHYGTDSDWNILVAEILPGIWEENLHNKKVRRMVAGCVLLFNAATTRMFFESATKRFTWNDQQFVAVQNLLLQYSSEYYRTERHTDDHFAAIMSLREKWAALYSEGKVTSAVLDWSTLRGKEQWKPKEVRHGYRDHQDLVRRAGLDTHLLVPMMQSMPDITDTTGGDEKNYLLSMFEQAFEQVIYELGEITGDSQAIDSLEKDFERIVLRKIAVSLLYIDDKAQQIQFWQPLLQFGYIAKNSIRAFCNPFFINLDKPGLGDKMVETLDEMVEYTYTCETWKSKHVDRFEDFRLCLLGLNARIRDFWMHDYSSFTKKAEAIYQKWFAKNKLNPHAIDALLHFMITPSGLFMLKNGLFLLNYFFQFTLLASQQPAPDGMVYVGHKDLDDQLASTLSALWQYHKEKIKNDEQNYKLYRELLQYLIAIQNVIGIELQDSLLPD